MQISSQSQWFDADSIVIYAAPAFGAGPVNRVCRDGWLHRSMIESVGHCESKSRILQTNSNPSAMPKRPVQAAIRSDSRPARTVQTMFRSSIIARWTTLQPLVWDYCLRFLVLSAGSLRTAAPRTFSFSSSKPQLAVEGKENVQARRECSAQQPRIRSPRSSVQPQIDHQSKQRKNLRQVQDNF